MPKNKHQKTVFNWSGGKDSALALYKILNDENFEIVSLLTTINRSTHRSSMHGIPLPLLEKQADSIGLPLYTVDLAPAGSMADYDQAMTAAMEHFKQEHITHFAFGDIFLHDVRSYREQQLAPYGIQVVEPLWNRTTAEIMEEFLNSGLQTIVVTTTAEVLGAEFVGRRIDRDFIQTLPPSADPCGENGEYHTFCYAGGMFRNPIPFTLGPTERMTCEIGLDDGTRKEYAYWVARLQE